MVINLNVEQGLFDELLIMSHVECLSIHDLILLAVNEHLNRAEKKLTKKPEEFKRQVASFIAKKKFAGKLKVEV